VCVSGVHQREGVHQRTHEASLVEQEMAALQPVVLVFEEVAARHGRLRASDTL
jgi:hypothetical protein